MGVQFSHLATNCVRYVGSGVNPEDADTYEPYTEGLPRLETNKAVQVRPSVCTRLGMVWRGLDHYKSPSNGVVAIRSPCPINIKQLNISLTGR